MLAIDSQHVQTTKKQDRIHLLNQLSHLSAVLREARANRHALSQHQQILHEQQQALCAQKHPLHEQETRALQEYASILRQLAVLRADE
jgi:hypothetical protein